MEKFKTQPDFPTITVIDPDDQPMWSNTRTIALTPSFAIVQLPIVGTKSLLDAFGITATQVFVNTTLMRSRWTTCDAKGSYAYVVTAFQAPSSPDYVSGPEYPPLPEFVPEPVYLEFMPAKDDIFPTEEQPLPAAASPTTESPGYIDEFDPKEDPVDYPADGGDKGDDEDESSDDDEDDDIDIEGGEEEDEYLAPADSTTVTLPAVDHAPSAEETEPFKTDESAATPPPHHAYCVTARMSIRPQTPISLPSGTKISRLMAIPTPPPSALSTLSSPLPQIPSLPLPLLSPPPIDPTYEEAPLGSRGPDYDGGLTERRFPRRTCRFGRGYALLILTASTTVEGVNQRVTELSTTFDRETSMIYAMIEEKQDDQALQRTRVNRLFRDMRFHAHTARLIEGEARASHTAWTQSMDASDAARSGVIALRTQVSVQQTEITDLRAADRRF
nr:hypothetical protein [Tanacetum cinerariifolium]